MKSEQNFTHLFLYFVLILSSHLHLNIERADSVAGTPTSYLEGPKMRFLPES